VDQINNTNSVVDVSKAKLIENQYIVVFNELWDDVRSEATAENVRIFTNQFINDIELPQDSIRSRYEYAIRGFSAKIHDPVLSRIQNDPRVKEVIQDVRAPVINHSNKEKPYESSELILSGQTTPWGISRVGGPLDGTGLTAWVLDTGIDLTHDDLNVNLNRSVSFIATENADDFNGHGTHVAGTIAAINNSIGVVGVAAGATVVSVKVVDQNGFGTLEEGIDGVEYVALNAHEDDVVNMSLCYHEAFFPNRQLIDDVVENVANTGIRFSIAAGNNADDAEVCSPGRVDHPNTWTVSAYRQGDEFVQTFDGNTPNCNPGQNPNIGSNFGNPPINYAAPGESILSLWRNGGTRTTCGTSMAAPHVAGLLLTVPNDITADGFVSNDPDGNPDPIAAYLPFGVTITGPTNLDHGQQRTWQANVENASGSVSYQWFVQDPLGAPWQSTGQTTASFTWTFFNDTDAIRQSGIRVDVTDATGQATDTHYVTISPSCGSHVFFC